MQHTPIDDSNSELLEKTLAEFAPKIWEGRVHHPNGFDYYIERVANALNQAPDHPWVCKMRESDPSGVFPPEKGYTREMARVYYLVHCYMR